MGASILAVAVTATYSQQAFAASLGVDFALLSDWERTVSAQYGAQYAVWKGHSGLAKRSVFVLDQSGVVRYRWVTDDAAQQPDLDVALDALRALPGQRPTGGVGPVGGR